MVEEGGHRARAMMRQSGETILVCAAAFGCIKGPSGAGKTEIPSSDLSLCS